jgi:hypothetical protein
MTKTDAEFINDPFEWPHWPLLPMVLLRKDPDKHYPVCCIMVDEPAPPYKVYYKTLGDFVTGKVRPQLDSVKFESYDTVEALLKDWRID